MFDRAMKFAAVGALGIALQLGVLQLLTMLTVPYLAATAVAVGSAVFHNFAWHRRWTWRDRPKDRVLTAFAKFALANGGVSLVGNVAVMALLVGVVSLPIVVANVLSIAACGIANYFLADRLVFSAT